MKKEFDFIPIFRGNDLYNAVFQIDPVIPAEAKPDAQKILDEVIKHSNKRIMFDGTCRKALCPFGLYIRESLVEKIPVEHRRCDAKGEYVLFEESLKEWKNIVFIEESIDWCAGEVVGGGMTTEILKELFQTVRAKNNNKINRVVILTDNLFDHAGPRGISEPDVIKKEMESVAKKVLHPDVILFQPNIDSDEVGKLDLVVADRHHEIIIMHELWKKFPRNTLVLPLESALGFDEYTLGLSPGETGVVELLQKYLSKV